MNYNEFKKQQTLDIQSEYKALRAIKTKRLDGYEILKKKYEINSTSTLVKILHDPTYRNTSKKGIAIKT